jgi:hypothetical protein
MRASGARGRHIRLLALIGAAANDEFLPLHTVAEADYNLAKSRRT